MYWTVAAGWESLVCRVVACVPVGRLAGRRTAAAAGAVGPFDAARYSQDAADGGGPRAQHPGCNEPAKELRCHRAMDGNHLAFLLLEEEERRNGTDCFGVIGGCCQRI